MILLSTDSGFLFKSMTFSMGFNKKVICKAGNLPGYELPSCRLGISSLFPFAKCFKIYQSQDKVFEEFSPFRNAEGGQPQQEQCTRLNTLSLAHLSLISELFLLTQNSQVAVSRPYILSILGALKRLV